MFVVPGAMEADATDVLFWGALSFVLVIVGAFARPVDRWLTARGKGHAVVHETGFHGGPSPRLVGALAAVAFVFGTAVPARELISEDAGGHSVRVERRTAHGQAARAWPR